MNTITTLATSVAWEIMSMSCSYVMAVTSTAVMSIATQAYAIRFQTEIGFAFTAGTIRFKKQRAKRSLQKKQ